MAPKMTLTTQIVLRVLLEEPGRELYGRQISEATGLESGTVQPLLVRLAGHGWLSARWEDVNPSAVGRPQRRYYRLTEDGTVLAREALARARTAVARLPGRQLP